MTMKIFNRVTDTASFLGLLLKGLNLLLDAFTETPQSRLRDCGTVRNDKLFEQVFYRKVYKTRNIRIFGWLNVNIPKLEKIITNSLALVVYENKLVLPKLS